MTRKNSPLAPNTEAVRAPQGTDRLSTPSLLPPQRVRVEASSHCQLACPSCPTANGAIRKVIGSGHLELSDFREFLDRNPALTDVELSNYGEMFLNPQLLEIIQCAFERQVVLHADNGVNLNFAKEEVLEGLVRYKFGSITCSIDGASAESYSKYRIRGKFDAVMSNIRKINEYKERYGSALPSLTWKLIVFGHNEDEIETARTMATAFNMHFETKLTWDDNFSPIRNPGLVQIKTGLPAVTRNEFLKRTGNDYVRGICYQLWHAPVVNWDGKLLGCCRNFWGDFGSNVFQDGFTASVSSEKMSYARNMLMGEAAPREDIPCTTCELYETMRTTQHWLSQRELDKARPHTGILLGILAKITRPGVHDVDVYVLPGGTQVSTHLMRSQYRRLGTLTNNATLYARLPEPGKYTICAVANFQLERDLPDEQPTIFPITVSARPTCQDMRLLVT